MILGNARKVFDLSQETDALRDRYGRNKFGQSCLMARRLVEHGVPYVTINYPGWDNHEQIFHTLRENCRSSIRACPRSCRICPIAICSTPRLSGAAANSGARRKSIGTPPWNGGRSHYGECFSVLVAGGGFKGGHIVGATDAKGEKVVDRPVYPQDLIGSILELLGIDPDAKLPNARGLDLQVMPSSDNARGMDDSKRSCSARPGIGNDVGEMALVAVRAFRPGIGNKYGKWRLVCRRECPLWHSDR